MAVTLFVNSQNGFLTLSVYVIFLQHNELINNSKQKKTATKCFFLRKLVLL